MNLSNELKKYSFLESAKKVAENLNLPVYIVGGFVRDIILNPLTGNRTSHNLSQIRDGFCYTCDLFIQYRPIEI